MKYQSKENFTIEIYPKSDARYKFPEITLHKNSRIKLHAVPCIETSAELRQNGDDSLVTSLCTVKSGGIDEADWTEADFNQCPRSGSPTTPPITTPKMTETEMNDQLDEIDKIIAKDPEAGAQQLLDLTENVDRFSEEAVDNFASMVSDIIDKMEKPISATASKSLMDSMTNMLRKVFKNI